MGIPIPRQYYANIILRVEYNIVKLKLQAFPVYYFTNFLIISVVFHILES